MKENTKTMDINEYKNNNEINLNDVLCGRGGLTNLHVGNKRYRYVVAEFQQEYLKARKNEKKDISRRIVARIRENGGRFLKRSADSIVWSEVTEKKAVEKTSQALREGLDVRHKTVRPEKLIHRPDSNSTREGASPKKRAKLVEGIVMESPKINEIDGEDVPDLVQDESPTQRFEPMFTFYPHMMMDPAGNISETDCENVHQI